MNPTTSGSQTAPTTDGTTTSAPMVDHASWELFYVEEDSLDCDCRSYDDGCPCYRARELAMERARGEAMAFGMRTMINAAGWHGVEVEVPGLLAMEARMSPIEEMPRVPMPPERRSLPAGMRKFVMERDAYRCQACGDHHDLALDHKIPFSRGGADTEENLHVLCKPCNSSKGTKTWEEFQEYRKAA